MQRVNLRKYTEEDLQDYYELINDEDVKRFMPFMECSNINIAKAILKRKIELNNNKLIYAIESTEYKRVIGEISAIIQGDMAEIEVMINSKYRGKGYAKEAFIELLESLKEKEINIKKMRALTLKGNKSSQNLFEKLEFKLKDAEDETKQNYCKYEREI